MQKNPPNSKPNLVSVSEQLPLWLPLVMIMGGVYACLQLTHTYRTQLIRPEHTHSAASADPIKIQITPPATAMPVEQVLPSLPPLAAMPVKPIVNTPIVPTTVATAHVCEPTVLLQFRRNHLRPNPDDFAVKAKLLKNWLEQHAGLKLVLEGYSDSVGTKQARLLYSYRRAKLARTMLMDAGIAEDRLIVDAHADTDAVTLDAESSRRVTVKAESAHECISHLFDGINK